MAGNIFISYRRDDAAAWAGRLHMALEKHFRRDQLFMDVDSIQAGLDFAKVIDAEVAKCDVMLVVIGKGWVDARDAGGRRRLDDPGDFVRLEVESALRRDIRVVPVLVDGASLPQAEELPEGMKGLVRRQAWPLSHARFGAESEGLIGEISRHVTPAGGVAAAPVKTDWVGERSWSLSLSIVGITLVMSPLMLAIDRWERAWPVSLAMFFASAVCTLLAPSWLRGGKLAALWLLSAVSSAFTGFAIGNESFALTSSAAAFLLTYALISGPALILWRRRKRGG